ncbi:MAG: YjcQ family protein [Desulfurivibrionaceae bacterium]|jgi:hypothetical protein
MKTTIKEHEEILKNIIKHKQPITIKNDEHNLNSLEYLLRNEYIKGFDLRPYGEQSFQEIQITDNGKLYLQQISENKPIKRIIKLIPKFIAKLFAAILVILSIVWIYIQIIDNINKKYQTNEQTKKEITK